MRIKRQVSMCILVFALAGSAGVCRAQGTDESRMPDVNAAKISFQVTADADYTWKLDSVEQGKISSSAAGMQIMLSPGRHEITADRSDGKGHFDRIFQVAAGKPNTVRIAAKSGAATTRVLPPVARTPAPAPGLPQQAPPLFPSTNTPAQRPSTPDPYAGNPDMFVRITPQASKTGVKTRHVGSMPTVVLTGWQISLIATPVSGTYYDVKLQVVMKGVGSAGSTIELPDPKPGFIPNVLVTTADELGKEAVVCYTARAASQPSQRWTGIFSIQAGASPYMAAFIPAHEPTLEPASDAPCGGIQATKAAPPSVTAPQVGNRESALTERDASLALARGSKLYNARRYEEARPLLIQACEGGSSPDACNSVGFMYNNKMGVATNYEKAIEYYLKACNDNSSLSCTNLGVLYRDALGVPRNNNQALALFQKGCDAGVPQGCELAGKMYAQQIGVPLDGARALGLFKQACEAELAAGCGDEGYLYATGIGVPRDVAFAASLFTRACDMGSPNSCASIGLMYRRGDGVRPDPQKATTYLQKACNLGNQQSCQAALR